MLLHENLDLNDGISIRRGALVNVDPGGMLFELNDLMTLVANLYGVPFDLFHRYSRLEYVSTYSNVLLDPGLSVSSEPATIYHSGERCKQ